MTCKISDILDDRYRIDALLAEGGMGAVYRAFDLLRDSPCAVKEFRLGYLPAEDETRLRPEVEAASPRSRKKLTTNTRQKATEQFFREAKLLAKLDHPNLPKVIDYFSEGDDYYLVMTLIEGQDLATFLEEADGKPLPEKQVMGWMRQVMDALRYCHEQGVIHRDVKPANVIVTPEGKAYLVDFGIAKPSNAIGKTTVGARATTPRYSPPEQYGEGHTDIRSDIYAVGAMIYALLTGNEPKEAIDRLTGEEMPSVRALNPSISMNVDAVVTRALSIRPADRFQSVSEMWETLLKGTRISAPIRVQFAGDRAKVNGQQEIKLRDYTYTLYKKPEDIKVQPPPVIAAKTDVLSIISLALGVFGIVNLCLTIIPSLGCFCFGFSGLSGLIGLIIGLISLNQLKNNAEKGRGMAIAGIVLSALTLFVICVFVILVATSSVIGNVLSQVTNNLYVPTP